MPEGPDIERYLADSPLYGTKLEVRVHRDRVIEELIAVGIAVTPSPTCFKIIHTNFKGSFRKLLTFVPVLSEYRVRQHRWWHLTPK